MADAGDAVRYAGAAGFPVRASESNLAGTGRQSDHDVHCPPARGVPVHDRKQIHDQGAHVRFLGRAARRSADYARDIPADVQGKYS